MSFSRITVAGLLAAIAVAASAPAVRALAPISAEEAAAIGTEAYIYGYPLVTMEMTRRVMTNVETPGGNHAPMGQFYNARTYPDAAFRDVTAPNADTLYSYAWIDLAKEPYVLSLPDEHDRYFLIPMLSAWTDVFQVPGKRTTGTQSQTYLISGPNWKGSVSAGLKHYKSPTNLIWILGRTYCTGTPKDYKAVHALQGKYSIVPLSAYGTAYAPPKGSIDPAIDMKTPVREQVNQMHAAAFFNLLTSLMKNNPPAHEDAPLIAKMARIGIVPGKPIDLSKLDPAVAKALEQAPKAGLEKIVGHMKHAGKSANGWVFPSPGGVYGTDYLQRATVAFFGLGCNRTQDAVYPTSESDADDKPYDGSKHYTMTFAKGELPPVNGFWSLTMYDAAFFFVANPLNRYTLSGRSALKKNDDGSVTLYIQNESPGKDRESNWLPAPKDKFILMLRMYWPKEKDPSIIDGSWEVPPVRIAEER